jgi:hypothetical protein
MLPGNAELGQVQNDDCDEEAEEEEAATEEEDLATVQQEIESLWQEQESILRRQVAMQCAKAHRQTINLERVRLIEMQYNLDILRQQGREAPPHNQISHQLPPPPPSPLHNQIPISKSCILRYIVLANSNPPVHQVGQGVIHDGLQALLFDMNDMHTLW